MFNKFFILIFFFFPSFLFSQEITTRYGLNFDQWKPLNKNNSGDDSGSTGSTNNNLYYLSYKTDSIISHHAFFGVNFSSFSINTDMIMSLKSNKRFDLFSILKVVGFDTFFDYNKFNGIAKVERTCTIDGEVFHPGDTYPFSAIYKSAGASYLFTLARGNIVKDNKPLDTIVSLGIGPCLIVSDYNVPRSVEYRNGTLKDYKVKESGVYSFKIKTISVGAISDICSDKDKMVFVDLSIQVCYGRSTTQLKGKTISCNSICGKVSLCLGFKTTEKSSILLDMYALAEESVFNNGDDWKIRDYYCIKDYSQRRSVGIMFEVRF